MKNLVWDEALENVEDLVLSFLTQLSEALPDAYSHSDVDLRTASGKKVVLRLADRTKEYCEGNTPQRQLVFPRQTRGPSARPFAQLFRVADLIHEALLDDIPTTKRDMYYKDVQLFRSQSTVDRLVDDLAATFQLSRADLNVRASSKGLICGSGLFIHLKSGDVLNISDSEASLIPQAEDIERFQVGEDLAWVLLVEKEAVFQTLCRLRFAIHEALPGPGLIMTGKGYPDVATRQLVRTLSDNLPAHVPILALVDGDAYGIDILSVYKHGSTRMQHENEHLAAARIEWLGLWASELSSLGIDKEALLPITKHDEKKARSMLKRRWLPAQWRRELQHMLFSRRKAEIEVLGAVRASRDADPVLGRDRPAVGGQAGIPLVRYLVAKICAACADPDHELL
ncbi:topoisomerase acting in meiosis [Lentinus brumalis]|uniref:DNA topoisomerase (ATP-hydrolyzing) n=1 Tax=Lentinus brumalis TaxID=2498619 RepID=A0A371CX12_9APHY|nr:topoisomerase acting in meiosis [Polyporus brumalis]